MTHSHMKRLIHTWHDSFTRVTLLIHTCKHDLFKYHITHSQNWRDSFTCVTWLIHMWHDSSIWDMTHLHMVRLIHMCKHDSFTCDMTHSQTTCLIHIWKDSFTYDVTHPHTTWLIHVWEDSFTRDMTHVHVWHDSFIGACMACLIHVVRKWDMSFVNETCHSWKNDMSHLRTIRERMTCLIYARLIYARHEMRHVIRERMTCLIYARHDSLTCVSMTYSDITWLIHMCDVTHSHVWRDSFTCVTWLIHICHDLFMWDMTHAQMVWLIHMCKHDSFTCDMSH